LNSSTESGNRYLQKKFAADLPLMAAHETIDSISGCRHARGGVA
jgi:hypothetical protein